MLSETVNAPFGRMDTALTVIDLFVHSSVRKGRKERSRLKPEKNARMKARFRGRMTQRNTQ